jgi:hypothetical protein
LISRGRALFEATLADPDSLAETVSPKAVHGRGLRFEDFHSVSYRAYERRAGSEMPERFYRTGKSKPSGEDWDEADLPRIVPRLWAKFGGNP